MGVLGGMAVLYIYSNPAEGYSNEPTPNGDRKNMGAYGNTSEASKVDSDNLGRLRVSVFVLGTPLTAGPAGARWRLSYEQDGTWHYPYNTGSYFTLEGLVPAGDYYVVFKDISGYITPSPVGPLEIDEDELVVTAGYYTEE